MAGKEEASFRLYEEWDPIFSSLPQKMAGELIQAVFDYHNGREARVEDPALYAIFSMMREKFEEEQEMMPRAMPWRTGRVSNGERQEESLHSIQGS